MSNEVLEFDALLQLLEERGSSALLADLSDSGDPDALAVGAALEAAQAHGAELSAGELASQIVAQLAGHGSWAIQALVREARAFRAAPWLEPTRAMTSQEPLPLVELTGHTNFVGGLVVLPDNRTVVTASEDGTMRVWDMQTGEQLQELREHGTAVNYLALTPDGTRLLSAGDDYVIRVWDIVDWSVVQTLRGHQGYVSKVAVGKNELVVSVSADQSVRVWDLGSGKCIKTFKEHHAWAYAVAMSPDGASAITASLNHTMIEWDLSTKKPTKRRTIIGDGNDDVHMVMGDVYIATPNQTGRGHKDAPNAIAWSADGRRFVSASNDVVVWDAGDLSEVARFADHAWPIKALALCDGDRKIVVGEHCIKIWDLDRGELAASWIGHEGKQIYGLAVSPDGTRLVTGDEKGSVKVWDLPAALGHIGTPGHSERVYPMSFSPDDSMLLSTSCDKSAIIWDVATNTPRHHLRGHEDIFVYERGWLRGGTQVISVCRGALRVWDAVTGELVRRVSPTPREGMGYDPREGYDFIGVRVLPDERRAVCGAVGESLARVDLVSGQMDFFEGDTAFCQEIVLSSDGRHALTMSYYDSYSPSDEKASWLGVEERVCPAQLWDIEQLELVRNYFPEVSAAKEPRDMDYQCAVLFSHDESHVFAGGSRGTVRAWDQETGELLAEHKLNPPIYVNAMRLNDAGELEVLAAYEGDPALYRFDTRGQHLLERRAINVPRVVRRAVSADWRWLAATISDTRLVLVDLTTGEPVCYMSVMGEISEMELSSDGSLLAVGDTQGQVHILRRRGV